MAHIIMTIYGQELLHDDTERIQTLESALSESKWEMRTWRRLAIAGTVALVLTAAVIAWMVRQ